MVGNVLVLLNHFVTFPKNSDKKSQHTYLNTDLATSKINVRLPHVHAQQNPRTDLQFQ